MAASSDLGQGIVRVVAPNPSPMTYEGTNTYLLGQNSLAVIDPGPDLPAHFEALKSVIGARRVSHILVTHSHLDHSPLAARLSRLTGAPVLAFGDSTSGQSAAMQRLRANGYEGGGEGIDHDFRPDQTLRDGEQIIGEGWRLTALHTPGHFGNHLCFATETVLFSGDHVMGWSTSLISPPEGDLGDFMDSCRKLLGHPATRFLPGHGAPVESPQRRLQWLIDHRLQREAQILTVLASGANTIATITRKIYRDLAPQLLPAAERNVFAHLVDLTARNSVTAHPDLGVDALYSLA